MFGCPARRLGSALRGRLRNDVYRVFEGEGLVDRAIGIFRVDAEAEAEVEGAAVEVSAHQVANGCEHRCPHRVQKSAADQDPPQRSSTCFRRAMWSADNFMCASATACRSAW